MTGRRTRKKKHNHGKIEGQRTGLVAGFGLGFGLEGVKQPLPELGSAGQYYWSGFFYTRFVIDPKERMALIFMCQRYPENDLNPDRMVRTLAQQAIID